MSPTYSTIDRDEDGRIVARTEYVLTPAERETLIRQQDAGYRAKAAGGDWAQAIADEMLRGPAVGFLPGEPVAMEMDDDGVPIARYGGAA